MSWSEFNWVTNALSDLGVVSGVTGFIFNFGLLFTGLLCLFFAAGLFNYFKASITGKVGSMVFAVASVWLMCIGVFNESFWPVHFVVAVLFFITLPVALLILMAALYLQHETKLAIFSLISSFIAAMPWILYFTMPYVSGVAVPETLSSAVGSIWIIVLSYQLLKTIKSDFNSDSLRLEAK
ncbi:MAG: DUF998 domain-containing protein [Candidatus Bathyarchaeota archaeon]|nr:DUF998 domain-containing protein [Candidatus Termiticorpusculum sp.]